MMDAGQCRERLGRLMDEEGAGLKELAVLLDREHQFLMTNDVVALEGANRERQKVVARIFGIDEDRRGGLRLRRVGAYADRCGLCSLLRFLHHLCLSPSRARSDDAGRSPGRPRP